jgi:hypothetical protein
MTTKYIIEIFYPYTTNKGLVAYESDDPYMNINIVDVLYQVSHEDVPCSDIYKDNYDLVVCGVSHTFIFSEDEGNVHKKMIFTKHVLSTENTKRMFE